MTEKEYINATNLRTVRIMQAVMRQLLPQRPVTDAKKQTIGKVLGQLEDKLSMAVETIK